MFHVKIGANYLVFSLAFSHGVCYNIAKWGKFCRKGDFRDDCKEKPNRKLDDHRR